MRRFAFFVAILIAFACGGSGGGGLIATPPAVPTNLVGAAGNGQVSLTWGQVVGATQYNVKRGTTSGGPFTTIGSPNSASFTDSAVTNGTTYFYVVSSVNAIGESANSTQVLVIPTSGLTAPTGFTGVPGDSLATLSWNAVPTATSYKIKRSLQSGGPYVDAALPATSPHSDLGLVNGTTYYYVISAIDGFSESPNSLEISVTPAP